MGPTPIPTFDPTLLIFYTISWSPCPQPFVYKCLGRREYPRHGYFFIMMQFYLAKKFNNEELNCTYSTK